MAEHVASPDELRAALPGIVDLGHDTWMNWSHRFDVPAQRIGLTEWHRCTSPTCPFRGEDGGMYGWCGGGVLFDLPGVREAFPGRALWTVESEDPLTIAPSIACSHPECTHHGFIRGGLWVPA